MLYIGINIHKNDFKWNCKVSAHYAGYHPVLVNKKFHQNAGKKSVWWQLTKIQAWLRWFYAPLDIWIPFGELSFSFILIQPWNQKFQAIISSKLTEVVVSSISFPMCLL